MPSPLSAYRRALATAAVASAAVAVVTIPTGSPVLAASPAAAADAVAPTSYDLTVGGLTDPLGIDDTTPTLQWKPGAGRHGQSAFQVRVASSPDLLEAPDLWDSGKTASSALQATYAGSPLDSRDHAVWQVKVWDATGAESAWSEPATFEVGLLSPADWEADWISNAEWNKPLHQDFTMTAPQTAQWIRITVTDLGRPEEPLDDPGWRPRLELGEVALRNGSDPANVVAGATVTASENKNQTGVWNPSFIVDGKLTTATAPRGYRSTYHPETDVKDKPIVLTIKLPEARTFDKVELYPLWDSPGRYGTTPNFPRDVTFATSTDGTTYTDRGKLTKLPAISTIHEAPAALPVFATDFDASDVASARLYVTGLGVYDATINGEQVSEDLLEPANTFHAKRVPYAAYDVTDLIEDGDNSMGIEVGNGIFNVFNLPTPAGQTARYVKTASGHGAPRVMGQLELTDSAGNVTTIATDASADSSWRTTLGDVTFTNWYGGEDVDARRTIAGWDEPGTDRSSWAAPVASSAPEPTTQLVGRTQPAIRQVDELDTTWTQLANGDYRFDFGVNFAGWQRLTTSGPAGTKITMKPGERLNTDGTVNQASSGINAYDTFTLAGVDNGTGAEVFQPRFRYHGMRWLQVSGLTAPPTADTMKGLVLRTSNESVGSFATSDEMLGKIHTIIDRSVQSNMYSVLTDCPHREKLGWMDQTNLNFDTVARGYDMQAQYRKLLQDAADSQTSNGLIPTTAPEDSLFAGAFRHDANWGATLSVSAWQAYQEYGDTDSLAKFWPQMVAYQQFLESQATGWILPGGLNDWATPEEAVNQSPAALVQTYAFHKITRTMADVADVLGMPAQARTYRQKTQKIADAFVATYYNPTTGAWSNGNQASLALALDEHLVPAELRPAAVAALVARIETNGGQFMVGEVGLYAILRVLAEEGRDDLVYALATRPTGNSYAKFVNSGSTSLPEHWSGSGGTGSQNHYMLGMLEGWLHQRLAGLRQADDSVAWEHLEVQPSVVGGVTSASSSYDSVRGVASTSWTLTDGVFALDLVVPGGATATVRVPNAADGSAAYGPRGAAVVPSEVEGYTQFEVGSGAWTFGSGGEAPTWATAVSVSAPATTYGSAGEVTVAVADADGVPVDAGTVTVAGLGADATSGATAEVVDGVATFTVPAATAVGTRTLQVAYAGTGRFEDAAGSASLVVSQAAARPGATVTKRPTALKPGRVRVVVSRAVAGGAGVVAPGGRVTLALSKGRTTVTRNASLTNGAVAVVVPKLQRGLWTIKVIYRGDARYLATGQVRTGSVWVARR